MLILCVVCCVLRVCQRRKGFAGHSKCHIAQPNDSPQYQPFGEKNKQMISVVHVTGVRLFAFCGEKNEYKSFLYTTAKPEWGGKFYGDHWNELNVLFDASAIETEAQCTSVGYAWCDIDFLCSQQHNVTICTVIAVFNERIKPFWIGYKNECVCVLHTSVRLDVFTVEIKTDNETNLIYYTAVHTHRHSELCVQCLIRFLIKPLNEWNMLLTKWHAFANAMIFAIDARSYETFVRFCNFCMRFKW